MSYGGRAALSAAFCLSSNPQTSTPFGASGLTGLGKAGARAVSELLAGGPSASGRSPGAARAREVRFLTPAGTASGPII